MLEYNYQQVDCQDFQGTVKIQRDPKPEEITIQNLIEKDTVLKNKWTIGLVL